MNIRSRFTVIGGAAIGLIAATAVYGAVSTASSATPTASTTLTKLAPAGLTPASTPAAGCAAGEELEHGVCVVHVDRVVVRPAPSVVSADDTVMAVVPGAGGETGQGSGPSPWGDYENEVDAHESEVGDDYEDAHGESEHANGEVEDASGEDS